MSKNGHGTPAASDSNFDRIDGTSLDFEIDHFLENLVKKASTWLSHFKNSDGFVSPNLEAV